MVTFNKPQLPIPRIPTPQIFNDPLTNNVDMRFDLEPYLKEVEAYIEDLDMAMIIMVLQRHGYTVEHQDPTKVKRLLDKLPLEWRHTDDEH